MNFRAVEQSSLQASALMEFRQILWTDSNNGVDTYVVIYHNNIYIKT